MNPYASFRMVPFSMTLNDPYPGFKVTSLYVAEYLRNGTIYRHSFNGILIGLTHALLNSVHFK